MTVDLGLSIATFAKEGPTSELFARVVSQAQEADTSGFDAVFVMDHFYQLPVLGQYDDPMLEAYTTLGALATATANVQLGTLVTGNSYRNPALLAKIITTLDVISNGRAILGIGTGWYQLEHDQLGFEFGTFTDRFDRLSEALQIIVPMLEGQRPTVAGRWYRTKEALAVPRLRDHVPLLIGGSGENKTFRLAAQQFDHLNISSGFDELPAKVQVLRQRCEELGRDPATLETSALVTAVADEAAAGRVSPVMAQRLAVGSVGSIVDQIQSKVFDAGVDGVILSTPVYEPGFLAELGAELRPLITARRAPAVPF
jgi:F420-dependent oxidoreductase-like protein